MMKKRMWKGIMLLAVMISAPAMAVVSPVTDQCWTFTDQPFGNSFAFADAGYLNDFGKPTMTLSDMSSQQDLEWVEDGSYNGDGYMQGTAFKIIIDVPNQPEYNDHKELTLQMIYRGTIDFLWIVDAETGQHFTQVSQNTDVGLGDGWFEYEQDFEFSPNPIEEIIVVGFSGDTAPAALDQVCIVTECVSVPEPASMALLALGSMCVMKRKRK
ncbi:MAG: PEP-CTERM sorting domain-containing protein [Planctomycetota bacterium]|jgi:hypothetical protein